MPRKMDPTFIPSTSPTPITTTLESIPQEIRDEVEQIYAALKLADGRFTVEYDTEQEVAEYEKMVKAYCKVRPGGEIRYRRSPAKGLPKTTIQFRIVDIPAEKEAATQAIQDAAAKVNAAAEPVDMTGGEAETPKAAQPRRGSRK